MRVRVFPTELSGTCNAIPSKSVAHRMLILAALSSEPTYIVCPLNSQDIVATKRCLEQLGTRFEAREDGWLVQPSAEFPEQCSLELGESGSTLRFLIPVLAALGITTRMSATGRLAERPIADLMELLQAHGLNCTPQQKLPFEFSGKIDAGHYRIAGNISSQYISGLLMAAPLMAGIELEVMPPLESRPYIRLSTAALAAFGVEVREHTTPEGGVIYSVDSHSKLVSPVHIDVEGDWSNAAFWLAAGALSKQGVTVRGLQLASAQGDRLVLAALARMGAQVQRSGAQVKVVQDKLFACTIDVRDIPDLVPALAVVAAHAQGTTRFTHAGRLRLKESDRLSAIATCLNELGGKAHVIDDELIIEGVEQLHGGRCDSAGDHRIAMMAALCSCTSQTAVEITRAESVAKSYPSFFDDLQALGGRCEKVQD